MDLRKITSLIYLIAEDKGIPKNKVLEIVEQAIAAAYKKDYGEKGQIIKAKMNPKTGEAKFWRVIEVVDKSMIYSDKELEEFEKQPHDREYQVKEKEKPAKVKFSPEKHIMLEEALKKYPNVKAGEEIEIPLKTETNFGRIAAQTAKQVVLQKIKEAVRESILESYKSKEGEIISGIVQRVERGNVYMDLGKVLGLLPKEEQIRGEFYKQGQRFKVYILKVEKSPRGPVIYLSRSYPKLVSKLFELEVPEISSGQVIIKSITREAGSRSKIAVASTSEDIDPVGAMIGQRGTRILAVINELGGEKIDIIEWSADPKKYISNALAPAKVLEVKIKPKNKALVIVPDDQLSLAIGRDGQNVRLAVKLTGWKIDVKSASEIEKEKAEKEMDEKINSEKVETEEEGSNEESSKKAENKKVSSDKKEDNSKKRKKTKKEDKPKKG